MLTGEHGSDGAAAWPCRTNRLHKESLCGAKSHTGVRDRGEEEEREGLREEEKNKGLWEQMIEDRGRPRSDAQCNDGMERETCSPKESWVVIAFWIALSKLRPCHKTFPEGEKSESCTQCVTMVL